jgi:2-keto-4-pentenoate hydratase
MVTPDITAAAERIYAAHGALSPCAPVRDVLGLTDVAAAYAAQEFNTRRWLSEGRRLVGRKIGLTAKSVQRQLGVDAPGGRRW